jgi:Rieske Fe-S protein
VVAYSAICTHQACPVNQWSEEKKAMVYSCHAPTYDPKNGANVIFGPAPKSLAALPLKSESGLLIVDRRVYWRRGRANELRVMSFHLDQHYAKA